MMLLDVNVVLAAHRSDHPHHQRVRPWFDAMLSGDEPFTVPDVVWLSLIRLATHPRVFTVPSGLDDLASFVEGVRAQPHHVELAPGEGHIDAVLELCDKADARGDLVPDAYLAALALENGCALISLDRDFARFPGLRWLTPEL